MGIKDWIKSIGSSHPGSNPQSLDDRPPDPLVNAPANIIGGRIKEMYDLRNYQGKNRYVLSDTLYNSDERLHSVIQLMAVMIQKSIGDQSGNVIGITQDDTKLSNEEENAIEEGNKFGREIAGVGLPRLFYTYTVDLWKYGDTVDLIQSSSKGIIGLQPFPMSKVTAVDSRGQVNRAFNTDEKIIMNPKWYIIDEEMSDTRWPDLILKKERIVHLSFNNRRNMVKDNLGRWTFNVWSHPPIMSLIGIIMWKQLLMRNDILFRNRNIPREWHKLDLSQYDPTRYTGSHSEKLAAAKKDAEAAVKAYNLVNQQREADQGIVTGMGVDISYIEPATAKYNDPSPILDQINSLIGGPTGTPSALMGGEGGGGFSSLVHASSFLALRAEIYAGIIQKEMEKLLKRHVKLARPGIRDEVVDRLFIKNRLILDRDRAELAKMVAVLTGSKVFTPDEIRQIWGLDPLTDKQKEQIKTFIEDSNPMQQEQMNDGERTPARVGADMNNRSNREGSATQGNEASAQRNRNNITRGDRRGNAPRR